MLEVLDDKIVDLCNTLVFSKSEQLNKYIIDKYKKVCETDKNTIFYVNNPKDFKEAKSYTTNLPFWGGKWLIIYDISKVKSIKELLVAIRSLSNTCCTLFFTDKYKQVLDLKEELGKQGRFSKIIYGNKLDSYDIINLYESLPADKKVVEYALLKRFSKEYRFNVESVFTFIDLVKQGESFKEMKDIIEAVGFGHNTVNELLITILKTKSKTASGKKTFRKKVFQRYNGLVQMLGEETVINYMISSLKAMVFLKELQLKGKYTSLLGFVGIDEDLDISSIQYLGYSKNIVADEIPLVRILYLLNLLVQNKEKYRYSKISLVFPQVLYSYNPNFMEV